MENVLHCVKNFSSFKECCKKNNTWMLSKSLQVPDWDAFLKQLEEAFSNFVFVPYKDVKSLCGRGYDIKGAYQQIQSFEDRFPNVIQQVWRDSFRTFGWLNKCYVGVSRDFFNKYKPCSTRTYANYYSKYKNEEIDDVVNLMTEKFLAYDEAAWGRKTSVEHIKFFQTKAREYVLYKLSTKFYPGLVVEKIAGRAIERFGAKFQWSTSKEDSRRIDFFVNEKPISLKPITHGKHCDNVDIKTSSIQLTYIFDKDGVFFDFSKLIKANIFNKKQIFKIKRM